MLVNPPWHGNIPPLMSYGLSFSKVARHSLVQPVSGAKRSKDSFPWHDGTGTSNVAMC